VADRQTREQIVTARQVLRRDGMTDAMITALEADPANMIEFATARQQQQAIQDRARRQRGDLRKKLSDLDPDFDPSAYTDETEAESDVAPGYGSLTPAAETPPGIFATAPEGQPEDRLGPLLDRIEDPELRREFEAEIQEQNGELVQSRAENAAAFLDQTVETLARSEFPALARPEGRQAFAQALARRDPEGRMLLQPAESLTQFLRDTAWAEFGSQIAQEVQREMVATSSHHMNGQPERESAGQAPRRELTRAEISRIAYEASTKAGPQASLGDARRVFNAMLEAASTAAV
jgi:hypothetical protein